MAAAITETNFNIVGEVPRVSIGVKAAQNDFVLLPCKGTVDFAAHAQTGVPEGTTYTTVAINNTGDAYTATSTSIVYDTAAANERASGGYYLLSSSGEILEVIADSGYASTGGTMTVRRGVLGTTASATGLADGNTLYVLNSIEMAESTTGLVFIKYVPLPNDPGVNLFG